MTDVKADQGSEKQDKKIGQIFLEMKVITTEELAKAMALQQELNSQGKRSFKIGEVLLFQKVITLPQLHTALRAQTQKSKEYRISSIETKKIHYEEQVYKRTKATKKDEKKAEYRLSDIFSFLKKKQ